MNLLRNRFSNFLILVAFAMVGCGGGDTTTNVDLQEPATDGSEQARVDSNNGGDNAPTNSPVVKLTWDDINQGAKPENREAFKNNLQGKTIEITGMVYGMERRSYTKMTRISLGDPEDQLNSTFVHAADGEDWAKVNVGDEVTYHIQWDNLLGFANGRVVSGGSPPGEFTAASLAQRFQTDPDKTKSELADAFIIVTGKVLDPHSKFEKGEYDFGGGDIALTLAGQENTPIVIKADLWIVNDPFKQAKGNDELRVFGQVVFHEADDSGKRPFQIGLKYASLIAK